MPKLSKEAAEDSTDMYRCAEWHVTLKKDILKFGCCPSVGCTLKLKKLCSCCSKFFSVTNFSKHEKICLDKFFAMMVLAQEAVVVSNQSINLQGDEQAPPNLQENQQVSFVPCIPAHEFNQVEEPEADHDEQ